MRSYLTANQGSYYMFFFRAKKQDIKDDKKEAQTQAIRQDMFKKIDKATDSMDKLAKLLDDESLGITGSIFYATGGDKRIKRNRGNKK